MRHWGLGLRMMRPTMTVPAAMANPMNVWISNKSLASKPSSSPCSACVTYVQRKQSKRRMKLAHCVVRLAMTGRVQQLSQSTLHFLNYSERRRRRRRRISSPSLTSLRDVTHSCALTDIPGPYRPTLYLRFGPVYKNPLEKPSIRSGNYVNLWTRLLLLQPPPPKYRPRYTPAAASVGA